MALAAAALGAEPGSDISLDGTWDFGLGRDYASTVVIPGPATDPAQPATQPVWFRRVVQLPAGSWSAAMLRLHGANGIPAVLVNGHGVPIAAAGPQAWECALPQSAAPGGIILLEISLSPSGPPAPAPSPIDVSLDLWDDVTLHLSGGARIETLQAESNWQAKALALRWTCAGAPPGATVAAQVLDGDHVLADSPAVAASAGAALIAVPAACASWLPGDPHFHRLRVTLRSGGQVLDARNQPWMWRDQRWTADDFEINGRRVGLRGFQVDWHEWLCDPEAGRLPYDLDWFEGNILKPMLRYGGNFILFSDGRPPRALIDLCARDGVVAQVGPQRGVVDGFGAIFLDGEGRPGESAAVRAEIMRDMGPLQSSAQRLAFQARLCARVAEQARLRGAPAIAPFCVLSSPGGRYHGFIGTVAEGRRKPVWDALAAANAPVSALLDFWDTDFRPGVSLHIPVVFFNETSSARRVSAHLTLRAATDGTLAAETTVAALVPAGGQARASGLLTLPPTAGEWVLSSAVPGGLAPAISFRPLRTVSPVPSKPLASIAIGVPEEETELRAMLEDDGMQVVDPSDPNVGVILLGRKTWDEAVEGGASFMGRWGDALAAGHSIVWLDVGIADPKAHLLRVPLPSGVTALLARTDEGESFIHPSGVGSTLWYQLPADAGQRWSGGSDGRIVPPQSLEVTGLTPRGVFLLWTRRGAQGYQVQRGPGFAYELQGQYVFSAQADDPDAQAALRARIRALAHEKPVLSSILNFNAPIRQFDMSSAYREAARIGARSIVPLVVAGPDLERTPVEEIGYGGGKGALILSQLETAGRLGPSPHRDPAAEQMVLNLLGVALDTYVPLAP